MATPTGVTPDRLKQILKRQQDGRFGGDYVPAILANRSEAPSISRPSILSCNKLGRDIHLSSQPERFAALLALYHPDLIDLHEQKMLPTGPSQHPLSSHPDSVGISLPTMRGTVIVAESLGCLKFHPMVSVPDPRNENEKMWVPYPYVGDLLLLMKRKGRAYCVNWTVKKHAGDFRRDFPDGRKRTNRIVESEKAIARHLIEETLYEDAGIRTIQFTEETVDPTVIGNLHKLFGYTKVKLSLSNEQRDFVLDKFKVAMNLGIPGNEVIQVLLRQGGLTVHECLTIFHQAIWDRELRVDLFSPILIDRPIKPEVRDVLDAYSFLFME